MTSCLFQRLKQLTKRQVDLNFEQLVQRYQAKQKEQEDMAFKAKYVQSIASTDASTVKVAKQSITWTVYSRVSSIFPCDDRDRGPILNAAHER